MDIGVNHPAEPKEANNAEPRADNGTRQSILTARRNALMDNELSGHCVAASLDPISIDTTERRTSSALFGLGMMKTH